MTRKMHLAGFQIAAPVAHSHAAWRHPKSQADYLDFAYYRDIARILERGKFDFLFFADVLATPRRYGNDLKDPIRRGTQGAVGLDPTMVVASLAGATDKLGLAVTKSATYYTPFDIARAFATLDHLSRGRMAWNVVTSLSQAEGQNFGYDDMLDHDQRYERAEEFLEVAFALWRSWEPDALVEDTATGVFADPERVHAIDHVGEYFKVRGPLNVPRSPQQRPVIIQAGASPRGKDYAARWAEAVFEIEPSADNRRAYYRDLKARVANFGRDPSRVLVFPAMMPFIGASAAEAREKQAMHNELADPVSGLITMSMHTDHDFAQYPIDSPIADISVPGSQGLFATVRSLSNKQDLTLRDVGKLYAQGITVPQLVGTARDVADMLEHSLAAEEADGFMISAAHSPGAFAEFVEHVVPELQRRKLFRDDYSGSTLREHLGLGSANLQPVARRPR
ncbi:MAG: LLM class flavin-dependent oxidoreductase [Proteobacteria bacterium]|nr:LLM class flavin-dependent oxidoreductase [Pseudomonadota bacterium]